MGNTLPKRERLHSKSDIDALLSKGRFFPAGEMKYCVRKGTGESVNRILISVSKKFFRRAVKRNLLKRRIREAYRTRKDLLEGGGTDILFVYSTKEVLSYERIAAIVEGILLSVGKS
jgi:ribonuclease P protein component